MCRSNISTLLVWVSAAALIGACSGPTKPTDSSLNNGTSPTTTTPAPGELQDGIFLASVSPSSGEQFAVTDTIVSGLALSAFQAAFRVVYKDAVPDAKLEVELLDAAGAQCWYGFYDHGVPAGRAETIMVSGAAGKLDGPTRNGTCAIFPEHIASIRATLLSLRSPEINGRLTRADYLTQTFPLTYTIDRYPPTPANVPATPPTITAVTYANNVPTNTREPPLPGDSISVGCRVMEADGAAMTITLTVAFDGVTPQKSTETFPAGASSSPAGAYFGTGVGVPMTLKGPVHLKITCDAINSRGETASQSIDIGATSSPR